MKAYIQAKYRKYNVDIIIGPKVSQGMKRLPGIRYGHNPEDCAEWMLRREYLDYHYSEGYQANFFFDKIFRPGCAHNNWLLEYNIKCNVYWRLGVSSYDWKISIIELKDHEEVENIPF